MTISSTKINEVSIGITNFCNAGCPQCHRTNPNGLNTVDWLPLTSWSLDDFKRAFPTFKNINIIEFCGIWGDPIMAKDIFEICKYIIDNSDCKIEILTNGSIRDKTWWWNLGVMCGNRLEVIFDIDGITQEMHQQYRRKTNLQKILNNMETLTSTFAKAKTFTVVFKHNEDYIEEIEKQNKSYGAFFCEFVHSNRIFDEEDKFHYVDENGEKQFLEKSYKKLPVTTWSCNCDICRPKKDFNDRV